MPFSETYNVVEPWACEAGCGVSCAVERIETSPRFLRIGYRCPVCLATVTRYYDIRNRGYISIGSHSIGGARQNDGKFVGERPCVLKMNCPRIKEFSQLLRHEGLVGDNVAALARKVAEATVCTAFNERELQHCFYSLTRLQPTGSLFHEFAVAYKLSSGTGELLRS